MDPQNDAASPVDWLPPMQVCLEDFGSTIRTTRTTDSFSDPFTLQNQEGTWFAGKYAIRGCSESGRSEFAART
jgi:hypothetical protein